MEFRVLLLPSLVGLVGEGIEARWVYVGFGVDELNVSKWIVLDCCSGVQIWVGGVVCLCDAWVEGSGVDVLLWKFCFVFACFLFELLRVEVEWLKVGFHLFCFSYSNFING